MTAVSIILDIVLILISIVLIAVVLMQQGQRQGLGAISGGAETFFGKNKARGLDAKLAKITKAATVAFIVLAIVTTIVVSHNQQSSADLDAAVNEITDSLNSAVTVEDGAQDATASEADAAATEAPAEADAAEAEATEAPAEAGAAEADAAEAEATDAPEAE